MTRKRVVALAAVLFLCLLLLQIPDDGIVVGERDGVVHPECVRLEVFRAKSVVDTHVYGVAVERPADAVARGAQGIGEACADLVVGVGDGRVVEVAHNDERLVFVAVDEVSQFVGLLGSHHAVVGNVAQERHL